MPLTAEQTQLTKIKQKRILKEIKEIQQTPIDPDNSIYESSPGCYVCINEEDITNHKIMIIGPEDTPYENGFYMFDYTYNKNHPFEAPSVKYLTTDGTVRFNPNLYTNGKVCLSILGTWSGPAWEPTMSLRVVCEYLRSILTENPIQNEPGFENCLDTQGKMYNKYVTSENYHLAIYKNLLPLPDPLKPFSKTINLKFIENFSQIINKLKTLNGIDKHLGKKIGPYHKELRFSIKESTTFLYTQFYGLYHLSEKKNFKETQLFEHSLIKDVFEKNKPFILSEIVKVCIENVDKNPQYEFTYPEIIGGIYNYIEKNKNKVDNYIELKSFIKKHFNSYEPDSKINDFIKSEKVQTLIFDLIIELILSQIDDKVFPQNIKIRNGSRLTKLSCSEVISISELND